MADADYFVKHVGQVMTAAPEQAVRDGVQAAYRWPCLFTGVQHAHFGRLPGSMKTPAQMARIQSALAPIVQG